MKIIGFMTVLLGFSDAGLVRRRISGRKWPWYTVCIIACIIGFGIGQNTNPPPQPPKPRTVVKYRNVRDRTPQTEAESLGEENESRKESLDRKEAAVRKMEAGLAAASSSASSASQQQKESGGNASPDLSALDYSGTQVIDVNGGNPGFSSSDLSTANGAWQQYHDLDAQNRVTGADAMLNQSLMPHAERESLYVNPTGWHNKRIASGWLYNRCHLIAYQLTGQNNNLKNLMTGTRALNNPCMTRYEDQIAGYLKSSAAHYVRYSVRPVFRGNDLLARGIQLRAESVGDSTVSFNVYIFNVEDGANLNYSDGTSVAR